MKLQYPHLNWIGRAAVLLVYVWAFTVHAETKLKIEVSDHPQLILSAEIGSTNIIQYTSGLEPTNQWGELTTVVMETDTMIVHDDPGEAAWRRFYRVITFSQNHTNPTPYPDPQYWVWIPPGQFVMGSPTNEVERATDESPVTSVTISQGFWMSKYEVTQQQYLDLMGSNPSNFQTNDLSLPVEFVTWSDAVNYCVKLTTEEQAAGRLPAGYAYRLPTEAEWEYVCRASTTNRFSHGDDLGYTQLPACAWVGPNGEEQTHPVGQKQANPWGLFDMYGNVREWCSDWYGSYPGGSVTDPSGPASGMDRIVRGGAWSVATPFLKTCRSAARAHRYPTLKFSDVGFRPVFAPTP